MRKISAPQAQSPLAEKGSIKPWKIFLSVFGFVSAALGYAVLMPDVSVSPYMTLDPAKPLETRFMVANNSVYPITHIQYNCELSLHIFENGKWAANERIGLDEKDRLGAKEQFSIFCGHRNPDGTYYDLLPEEINKTLTNETMNIYVHFELPFYPGVVTRTYGFHLMRTKDGSVQWLPTGAAKPLIGMIF